MILKTLTHDHGEADCWNYYDNIQSASVFFNEELKMSCVSVQFNDSNDLVTIGIENIAYLCNDNGKTIEKLVPYKENNKNSKEIDLNIVKQNTILESNPNMNYNKIANGN